MTDEGRVELWLDFNWTHQDFTGPRVEMLLRRLFGMPGREVWGHIPPRPGLRQPKRGPWHVVTDLSREQALAFVELFRLYGVPDMRMEIRP